MPPSAMRSESGRDDAAARPSRNGFVNARSTRKLRLPDSAIRILLQKTADEKTSKERMHLDLETDDVEAEVRRLEALGATRWDHQKERGFDFWVMRDPWLNEFCVLQPEFPELLARRRTSSRAVISSPNAEGGTAAFSSSVISFLPSL